ncbi:MAG: rRNA methyltransferase [Chloroflexales bacterium]|nr:rRNA methyltransferase [Chloroflexales bacterium]
MELPSQLRLSLERELRGHDGAALAREAASLSARYRGGGELTGPQRPTTALAYAATRMPATYAATAAAMAALDAGLPGLAPRTLLDIGAGTGAALWAAASSWPGLEAADLIERDATMLALGGRLAAAGGGAVAGARWIRADVLGPWQTAPHDLVTAAYVLGELPEAAQATLTARLWALAAGALLLVEPGTPRGWATIRAARERLRAAGARIVAPCPHEGACPLPDDPTADWCHFAQRLARSRAHRAAKGADLGYEDEKYAYIAVARPPGDLVGARVLRHPVTRPGRIELTLCTRDDLRRTVVTKGDREAWRLARNLEWGDGIGPEALALPQ